MPTRNEQRPRAMSAAYGLKLLAEAGDAEPHRVAAREIAPWPQAESDALQRGRCQHITRIQRHETAHVADAGGHTEDHVGRVA
jgi:hypothetical protein